MAHGLLAQPCMKGMGQDLRLALRTLAKRPGYAILLVTILGIGIGANTALFSVVDATLLRPLPYPHPERLVDVAPAPLEDPAATQGVTGGDFTNWQKMNRSFEHLAAYRGLLVNLSSAGPAEPV